MNIRYAIIEMAAATEKYFQHNINKDKIVTSSLENSYFTSRNTSIFAACENVAVVVNSDMGSHDIW